jgi:hypothetical protein
MITLRSSRSTSEAGGPGHGCNCRTGGIDREPHVGAPRRSLALLALAASAVPAHARVALLATGTNEVALLDATHHVVAPRCPAVARVAITRDGR